MPPYRIQQWHGKSLIAEWKNRGEAVDKSGTLYLHQQFRKSCAGKLITHSRQIVCLTDKEIEHLLQVPETTTQEK